MVLLHCMSLLAIAYVYIHVFYPKKRKKKKHNILMTTSSGPYTRSFSRVR